MSGQTAEKDWYLDAEGNLTDDAEKGATHLVREGQEITADMAGKYDFSQVAQPEDAEAEGETEDGDESKADSPKANKADKAGNNKGVK